MKKLVIGLNIFIAVYFFFLANIFFWGSMILMFVSMGKVSDILFLFFPINMLLAYFLIYGSIMFFRKAKKKYLYGLLILGIIFIETQATLIFQVNGVDVFNVLIFGLPIILPFTSILFVQYLDKKLNQKFPTGSNIVR